MRIWQVALVLTLAAALVMGIALPALAGPDETPPIEQKRWHRLLKGEVIGIDESSFTIQTEEQNIKIRVNEDTRFFRLPAPQRLIARFRHMMPQMPEEKPSQTTGIMPRLRSMEELPVLRWEKGFGRPVLPFMENLPPLTDIAASSEGKDKPGRLTGYLKWHRQFGKEVTFEDLVVGDSVVVWTVAEEEKPLAKLVLIMTPMPFERIIGTVYQVNEADMTIIIEPLSGTENELVTLEYDDKTIFVLRGSPSLKKDMKAVVIYVEDDGDKLAKRVSAGFQAT